MRNKKDVLEEATELTHIEYDHTTEGLYHAVDDLLDVIDYMQNVINDYKRKEEGLEEDEPDYE